MEKESVEMTALKKDNGALTEDTAVLLPGASNGNAESEERPRSSLYVQVLDEKIPLFLVKLWNIVDDPSYRHIVRWDDSGYSFHIVNPQLFCRQVLPLYYKHNNLNSLIRQLNMYGFRKIAPVERTGLLRGEGDQDHLEFSHPCFMRGHPDLLSNIKRKSPSAKVHNPSISSIPSQDISLLINEIKKLRDNQRIMESKMASLVKENESVWQQLTHLRSMHVKQQQVVNKLVQFLVALVHPSQKRLGKRNLLAIDERSVKRSRMGNSAPPAMQSSPSNLSEVLDRLQQDLFENGANQGIQNLVTARNNQTQGPIIADVTEELETRPVASTRPASRNDMNHCLSVTPPVRKAVDLNNDHVPTFSLTSPPSVLETARGASFDNSSLSTPSALTLSPSLDRQICDELTDYLTGQENAIESCRELLGSTWDSIIDDEPEDVETQRQQRHQQLMLEGADPLLALDDVPVNSGQSLSLHPEEQLDAGHVHDLALESTQELDSDPLHPSHMHGMQTSATQGLNHGPPQLNRNALHRLSDSPASVLNADQIMYLSDDIGSAYLLSPVQSQESNPENYSPHRNQH